MNSARSWTVWGAAVAAYVIAVLQRSSLGVAGVDAAERFAVSASALSTLAVLQIIVYAAMQVPVGVVLDRVGPKALIATGSALLGAGQIAIGFAPEFSLAVLGRVLVGMGDAMIFISVIRLLTNWFSGRVLPQLSQWTGNVGQLGQLLSALPFAWALHGIGWTWSFAIAGGLSLIALVVVLLLVADAAPDAPAVHRAGSLREAGRSVVEAMRRPGTRLGFWSHYVTQSSGTAFALLWGTPALIGLGYSRGEAAAMLTLLVVSGVLSGPVLGILTARHPMRRSNLVLGIVVALAIAWSALLAWPGEPPLWLIVIVIVVIGVGGPGSLIGFDFARTFNPLRNLGSANGVVNVGGFLASFVIMYLVGLVLDLIDRGRIAAGGDSDLFSWDSFRVAFLVQYVVVGFGVVMLLRSRRRTRERMKETEGIEVAPLWRAVARAWRRREQG